jgi:hypothetical protein
VADRKPIAPLVFRLLLIFVALALVMRALSTDGC